MRESLLLTGQDLGIYRFAGGLERLPRGQLLLVLRAGKARLGQADITPKLLELARVPGDPLAPSALVGLGYLGSPEALPIVQEAISSRSEERVIAATQAAARLLARPELKSEPIRDRLAALLADPDASPTVRDAPLEALIALNDSRLVPTLTAVARDANLEGTPLLTRVETELAKRSNPPGSQEELMPKFSARPVVPRRL